MVSILEATDPLNISCSRLSDSGEDAKVNGTRGNVGGEKKFPVSFRFIFVFALSLFSGPHYLGAWNRLPWNTRMNFREPQPRQKRPGDEVERAPPLETRSENGRGKWHFLVPLNRARIWRTARHTPSKNSPCQKLWAFTHKFNFKLLILHSSRRSHHMFTFYNSILCYTLESLHRYQNTLKISWSIHSIGSNKVQFLNQMTNIFVLPS